MYIYTPFSLSIYLLANIGVDYFHLFATVNNAMMNMGVQLSLQNPALNSFGCVPKSGVAGSHGSFYFYFFEDPSYYFP